MYTYPFNPHATNQENNIDSEKHQLTRYNSQDYFFVIPKYAPFFAGTVVVHKGGELLHEGQDYTVIMPYVSATRATTHHVYGGLSFNSHENETVSISYMTIGGVWVMDTHDAWKILAEQTYNPRLTYWDQINNVPEAFPPIHHTVNHSDFEEFGTILTEMGKIARAIDASHTNSEIMEYLIDTRSNKFSMLKQELLQLKSRVHNIENSIT